jgi:PAS domain S-box-containing protein
MVPPARLTPNYGELKPNPEDTEIINRLLAAIVEGSDDAILSKDLNGVIQSWNAGAERIFGYTASEVIGKPVTILIPAGRLNEEPEILRQIRSGQRIDHYETVRQRKDGTLVDISLTISPIKDASGKIVGASKIARDITERIRAEIDLRKASAELDRLNAELERRVLERTASLNEALAQMQEFSYTVSHDLRSPARAIQGYAKAILEDFGKDMDDRCLKYLWRIIRGSAWMDTLIQDVLTYSRLASANLDLHPISPDTLIREIIQHYPEMQSPHAHIRIDDMLLPVLANETTFLQAVTNILDNAVKFVAPQTTPEIHISSERRGGQVRLWFSDNGIGIEPAYQSRLFGMFERATQDKRYEGTGIGLAITRKAVEKMGGKVGVVSNGRQGSSFWIELQTPS